MVSLEKNMQMITFKPILKVKEALPFLIWINIKKKTNKFWSVITIYVTVCYSKNIFPVMLKDIF